MKVSLFLCFFALFLFKNSYSQQLRNVLDGYTISEIPTERSIVGAKWVSGLGAISEGLDENELTISQSLNEVSLDKENQRSLSIALLSNLGLSGATSNDVNIIFKKLEVYSIKNLYEMPLSKGDKIVFSSIKATTFEIEFNKQISGNIMAKLPESKLSIASEVDLGDKKRVTMNGTDLFVAHKIVKIDNVKSKTSSKKLKSGFSVKKLQGYDISFDVDRLLSAAADKTIEEIGLENYNKLIATDTYIQKYSLTAPISVNIMSKSRGTLSSGIFNESINICYCDLLGSNKKLYPINVTNTGDKITFDYLYIDNFWIHYKLLHGVYAANSEKPIGLLTTSDNSKVSLISKTYILSKDR